MIGRDSGAYGRRLNGCVALLCFALLLQLLILLCVGACCGCFIGGSRRALRVGGE